MTVLCGWFFIKVTIYVHDMLLHQPRLIPSWEWEVSTVSCLQQPCSATVVSCPWFLLWSQSSHFFSCFLLPSLFPRIIVFSKESCILMMCPKEDSFSFVIFAFSDDSCLICSNAYSLYLFGSPESLPSSPPTLNEQCLFIYFFYQPSSLSSFCIHT